MLQPIHSPSLFEPFRAAGITGLQAFADADAAVARIAAIYDKGVAIMREAFARFTAGESQLGPLEAYYPFLGIEVDRQSLNLDARRSFGALHDPGVYGTTLTRPALFGEYYRRQIALLLEQHGVPVVVGISSRRMPLPFVIQESTADLRPDRIARAPGGLPLAGHEPDRRLDRERHLPAGAGRAQAARAVQRGSGRLLAGASRSTTPRRRPSTSSASFCSPTTSATSSISSPMPAARSRTGESFTSFVEPGEVITPNRRLSDAPSSGQPPRHLPQMPAYHLIRPDRTGITMVNIGIGPSNARTITDHLAVLRPHCWLMLGHCAGLRRSQQLGDYVLAHAYAREDHVLDQDLPLFVAVPPIAEVQVALQQAVVNVTGLPGPEIKTRMRTGTVATTDNRNWELRYDELYERLNQQRAIAVDMESGTIAANGFRLRVPYGTLLCVSDKPLHGELKLRGMANQFYEARINQHLLIGIEAIRILRDEVGPDQLHSRKLRSFDEPAFR